MQALINLTCYEILLICISWNHLYSILASWVDISSKKKTGTKETIGIHGLTTNPCRYCPHGSKIDNI